MSTEELIALLDAKESVLRTTLRTQSADLDIIRKELHIHNELSTDMRAAANTDRIARIKAAIIPFSIDTSTWTG